MTRAVPEKHIIIFFLALHELILVFALFKSQKNNAFSVSWIFSSAMARMIRQMRENGLRKQKAALKYIGKRFRVKMSLPEWKTDEEITQYLLK